MSALKEDVRKGLKLLEKYRTQLEGAEDLVLQNTLSDAIAAIRSTLFTALLDIHDVHITSLELSKVMTTKSPDAVATSLSELSSAQEMPKHLTTTLIAKGLPNEGHLASQAPRVSRSMSYASAVEVCPTLEQDECLKPVKEETYPDIQEDVSPVSQKASIESEKCIHLKMEKTLTIAIEKKSGGFGISISGGLDRPLSYGNTGIYITKIIPDTLAAQDGRLRLGDQLLSVNGTSLECVTHSTAVDTLKQAKMITLVIRRTEGQQTLNAQTPY